MVAAVLLVWRRLHRGSFTRLVVWRCRGVWRSVRVYRFCWQPAVVTTGLHVRVDGAEYLPRLLSVPCTGGVDRVWVRMLPGQTLEDRAAVRPRLAQTFDALVCRVRTVRRARHQLVLWFLTTDPLTEPVPPFEAVEPADLGGLPVAVGEDGLIFRLPLLGTHVLVVGATGSGRGSVLWSVIAALGPGSRDGLVQVWAVDPKGGMELAPTTAQWPVT